MCWGWVLKLRLPLLLASWTISRLVCPSLSSPSKSMAEANGWLVSSSLARPGASASSSCHHTAPSSTAPWNEPTGTHTEEFWECYDGDLDVASARTALLAWEHRYNTVRPHQALGCLTPLQFVEQSNSNRKE